MSQRLEASGVKTPTQLVAATIILTSIAVTAFATAAAKISSPPWLPVVFAVAAVIYIPMMVVVVFVLLTKHRNEIRSDEALASQYGETLTRTEKLDESLTRGGLDIHSLIVGKSLDDTTTGSQQEIKDRLDGLLSIIANLQSKGVALDSVPPPALLQAAKGLMASHHWTESARYLDEYVKSVDDWRAHWSRGVAYANQRGGAFSDIRALRGYNDALALVPETADADDKARLYAYRAAMLKRLHRLEEAETDLEQAKRFATREYELIDITYNLACVYAMMGRRSSALNALRTLKALGHFSLAEAHLDDYFMSLKGDAEFQALVTS